MLSGVPHWWTAQLSDLVATLLDETAKACHLTAAMPLISNAKHASLKNFQQHGSVNCHFTQTVKWKGLYREKSRHKFSADDKNHL